MKTHVRIILVTLLFASVLHAGETGKIAGKVVDETGAALPFANLSLQGTLLGGVSDINGLYFIINIPPGSYTLKASFVGYTTAVHSQIKVSVDRTTPVDVRLVSDVVSLGREVLIVAQGPLVIKDKTSSAAKVSAEEIEALPVQELGDLIKLQAGIVVGVDGGIHIRGGRSSEISYMVNGISITDPFSGDIGMRVENNAVQELTVVSGTFNAEYGQAQSGIINIVTKTGGDAYTGSVTAYGGSYVSGAKEYLNINSFRPLSYEDLQGQLSGPLPSLQSVKFFVSGRYANDDGYLYGKRLFNVGDSSDFSSPVKDEWTVHPTGDGAFVPMNNSTSYSYQGSVKFPLARDVNIVLLGSYNKRDYKDYDHSFKYNPDGNYQKFNNGRLFSLSLTHVLSQSTFYEIKAADYVNTTKYYTFANPVDPRYAPDSYMESKPYNFKSGGAKMERLDRSSSSRTGKFEINSQADNINYLKAGIDGQWYNLTYDWFRVINNERTNYTPNIDPAIQGPFARDAYDVRPVQLGVYVQDKLELKDLVVNMGIRLDYFNSRYDVPTDFRNPTDSPKERATAKKQISPRLGVAYPISDKGALHFSYGHFFQIPPFEYLYYNPEFEINSGSLTSIIGNANLEPEQTVSYEIGLQQQLTDDIVLDATGFYKDIRNLLSTEIHRTSQQTLYARYVNHDYGNVRGVTVSLSKRKMSSLLGASLDYTFSIAEGNSSDPNSVFLDNQSSPPIESEVQPVPLNWDQRHTINATISLGENAWGVDLIGRYGSGLPYTPTPNGIRSTSFPQNSEKKPSTLNVDLQASYGVNIMGVDLTLMASVFNLLDRRNELQVFSESGRAGYTVIPGRKDISVVVSSLDDWLTRPDFYSAPRLIKIGVQVLFH